MAIKAFGSSCAGGAGGDAEGGLAGAWLAGAGRADGLRGERLTPVIERGGESEILFRHSRPCQANDHVAEVFGLVVAESVSSEAALKTHSF